MCYGLAKRLPLPTARGSARGVIKDLRMRYHCDIDLCTMIDSSMVPLREQTASVCQIYSSLYSLRLNKAGAKYIEKVSPGWQL